MIHTDRRPRVAILWQGLSGYSHAAFAALRDLGVDVVVFHQALDTDAPFEGGPITAGLRTFAWQEGYAAFTVGWREREIVRSYIEGQEDHHNRKPSLEELVISFEEVSP